MGLEAIVKLTVFLTEMSRLRDYTRIKADFFGGEQPASTAVGVTALARPGMMVEVEAFAVA
jgi:2-iminobutanoate/2-iminopropanoate deaminase